MFVEGVRFYVGQSGIDPVPLDQNFLSDIEVYVGGLYVTPKSIQTRRYEDGNKHFTVLLFPPHRIGATANIQIIRRSGDIELCELALLGSPGLILASARSEG
jgi:hypothetical protein